MKHNKTKELYYHSSGLTPREKKIRKKRKKNRIGKKKPKRFRERILPDTNIWSGRIRGRKKETAIIEASDYHESLIYSGYVDEELSHVKSTERDKDKFEAFRKKMKPRMKRAYGSADQYSTMIKGRDKFILRDAEELGADVIVTEDSDFSRIKGTIRAKAMDTDSFLDHLKKRNKYRKKK